MNIIELGMGKVKIEPCFVSETDKRQAILFEPQDVSHAIGILTGEPAAPYIPHDDSTLLILGSIKSAEVLAEQLRVCIEEMKMQEQKPKCKFCDLTRAKLLITREKHVNRATWVCADCGRDVSLEYLFWKEAEQEDGK